MKRPPPKRGRNRIRELRPPAQPPQGETRIYPGRVKSVTLAAMNAAFVLLCRVAASVPPRPSGPASSPLDGLNGLAIPLGVVLFSVATLLFTYYAVTPIPLFRLNAETLRFQRFPWWYVEIAWSAIRSVHVWRETIYPPFISTLVLTFDMTDSVALAYRYGRQPKVRPQGFLLDVSYSDIVRAISQYAPVTLIHADWYIP